MKSKIARAPRLGAFISTMQPTYATFNEVMEAHNNHTFAEIKHDGYRIQIHRGNKTLKIFTRNGNQLNYECYPDITEIAKKLPVSILDAELVAQGSSHKEVYDNVKKRFRRPGIKQESVDKYLQSGIINDNPLSLRVFDALRFEKKGLLHLPFEERTSYIDILDINGLEPVDHEVIRTTSDLEALVGQVFKNSHEGIVCKNPESLYRPGSKSIDWVKFKRSETLDLAVVGFYLDDEADIPFTSVLCATYNDKTGTYETLGKIGVTRDTFSEDIYRLVKDNTSNRAPRNVSFSEKLERASYEHHVPDIYIAPEDSVVLEVKAMNLCFAANWQTCGEKDGRAFSMRIGYANQLRYDKDPKQATTTDAIRKLYALQSGGKE
ncbi:hypothetical protein ACFL3V_07020 [Nanoarchaeota archaeon]